MKFFEIDPGAEFKALPESQREQLCSEWGEKKRTSRFQRWHGRIALLLYCLVLPVGLFLVFTSFRDLSRFLGGVGCIIGSALWFLLAIAVEVCTVKKFMKSRAMELADEPECKGGSQGEEAREASHAEPSPQEPPNPGVAWSEVSATCRREGNFLVFSRDTKVELPKSCVFCCSEEDLSDEEATFTYVRESFSRPKFSLTYYRCGSHAPRPINAGKTIFLVPLVSAAIYYLGFGSVAAAFWGFVLVWGALILLSHSSTEKLRMDKYADGVFHVAGFCSDFLENATEAGRGKDVDGRTAGTEGV